MKWIVEKTDQRHTFQRSCLLLVVGIKRSSSFSAKLFRIIFLSQSISSQRWSSWKAKYERIVLSPIRSIQLWSFFHAIWLIFQAVTFSVVAVLSVCVTLPMVYNYIHHVRRQMHNEINYCKVWGKILKVSEFYWIFLELSASFRFEIWAENAFSDEFFSGIRQRHLVGSKWSWKGDHCGLTATEQPYGTSVRLWRCRITGSRGPSGCRKLW